MKNIWQLASWNVNGWRAIRRKGAWETATREVAADVWCLQEIKTETPELSLTEAGVEIDVAQRHDVA